MSSDNNAESTRTAQLVKQSRTDELEARLKALEKQNELLIEAFEWGANQIRPMFGQGAIALVFDGIAEGLKNPKGGK